MLNLPLATLNALPEVGRPSEPDDPHDAVKLRVAGARQRNVAGSGATACLRAQAVDQGRVIPPAKFVRMAPQFFGIEAFVAAPRPWCGAPDTNTYQARILRIVWDAREPASIATVVHSMSIIG